MSLLKGQGALIDCPICKVKLDFEEETYDDTDYIVTVQCHKCGRRFQQKYSTVDWKEYPDTWTNI